MTIRARASVVAVDDVDTDQILPARFLNGTTREDFGVHVFADWAVRPRLSPVLVAGTNFGCGSSREHAVWALSDAGVRAVVSGSLADIFRTNALKNGIVPAQVPADFARTIREGDEVVVDVEACEVRHAGRRAAFALDPFARRCLLDGVDEMGYLLARLPLIARYERG
jgi:3-isopropylmalate/(R)-2-methylmalate dehydratase small subunit